MNPSYPSDPDLHRSGSVAARHGSWQSGCHQALERLGSREEIQPLGQSA